jgi:voltage-gated potassium channel
MPPELFWGSRLLRLLRLGAILTRLVQRERLVTRGNAVRLVGLLTVLVVVVSGAVGSLTNKGDVHSVWDGIWWGVETVTTAGYGDVFPTSVAGRLVAIVVMLVGIRFLSALTATIASYFVEHDSTTEELVETLPRIEATSPKRRRGLRGADERGRKLKRTLAVRIAAVTIIATTLAAAVAVPSRVERLRLVRRAASSCGGWMSYVFR